MVLAVDDALAYFMIGGSILSLCFTVVAVLGDALAGREPGE